MRQTSTGACRAAYAHITSSYHAPWKQSMMPYFPKGYAQNATPYEKRTPLRNRPTCKMHGALKGEQKVAETRLIIWSPETSNNGETGKLCVMVSCHTPKQAADPSNLDEADRKGCWLGSCTGVFVLCTRMCPQNIARRTFVNQMPFDHTADGSSPSGS